MTSKTYGYIWVFSADQNEASQWIAVTAKAVPKQNIYRDKQSRKDFNRPQLRGNPKLVVYPDRRNWD